MVGALELFGIKLVGLTAENGVKFLLSIAVIVVLYLLRRGILMAVGHPLSHHGLPARFWTRQIVNVATTILLVLLLLSIWFSNPTRLAIGIGLVTAGLAFALQRVITALAGYLVILRGKNFNVGDRIVMGRPG